MRLAIGALVASLWLPSLAQANLCLMVFQMADNNLEKYLRQDFQEILESDMVADPTQTTWIYFDALNDGLPDEIPNLYDASGAELGEKFLGSRYITYSHTLKKMVVDTTIDLEQNSDATDVGIAFFTRAITDCVAKGSDTWMLIMSSHGGGTIGFGGDEFTDRKLLQSNQDIASSINTVLTTVPGAPAKLDVLGFDACLMQGFGVVDDYVNVAKYTLASEAVEPGHGTFLFPLFIGRQIPTSWILVANFDF